MTGRTTTNAATSRTSHRRTARRPTTGDLARRYLDGATVAELAAANRVHPATIYRRLHVLGVAPRGPLDRRDRTQIAGRLTRRWLTVRLARGDAIRSIAHQAGVDPHSVLRAISDHHLADLARPVDVEVRDLYETGLSYTAIAARLDIHQRTVMRRLQRAGGTPRPRGRPPAAR